MPTEINPKPALLDANFLIALIDSRHEFHRAALSWFRKNREYGWATCPITQNACLRILSRPVYGLPGSTVAHLRALLVELTAVKGHRFWPDSVSLMDSNAVDLSGVTANQITDLYLLQLAIQSGGRLVTFDRRIPWQKITSCQAEDIEIPAT